MISFVKRLWVLNKPTLFSDKATATNKSNWYAELITIILTIYNSGANEAHQSLFQGYSTMIVQLEKCTFSVQARHSSAIN